MGFLESYFELLQDQDRERPEVAEVRQTILNKLMYIFLVVGLPAMIFGVIRSYSQGRWRSSIIYLSFYLLFLVATLGSRRFTFRARALTLVLSLFLMGLTSLVAVGMSGSGVQMMLGVCLLVALLFGLRGGMLAMLLTFVCISVVATAMTTGFIDISPAQMMTSRSPVPWLTAICMFLMIVSVTVIGFQMFSTRIQESLDMLEENKRELETKNRDLANEIQERKKAEEKIRVSEGKFRSLVEATSDWIWETGADGKYTYASPRVSDLLGYEPEAIIGRTPFDIMAPGEAERLAAMFDRIGAEKKPFFNLENVNLHKDGHWVVLETSGVPRLDSQGNLLGYRGVDRDITERKLTEEALRASEKEYRSVIENIQDVFYRSDAAGRLLMGSPSGARMFGYDSVHEMIGLPLDSFWPDPEERQQLLAQIKATGSVKDFEAVLNRKDGTPFNASFTTHFYYDDNGNFVGTEGIIRDITDRKRAEEALKESERQFRDIAEMTPQIIYEMDTELQLTFLNKEAMRIFGITEDDLLKRIKIFALFPPEEHSSVRHNLEKIHGEGSSRGNEYLMLRKDGSTFPVIAYSAPIFREGQFAGFRGVITDITERKRAEEEVRQLRNYLANIIDSMPSVLVGVDLEGRVTQWNQAAERATGLKAKDAQGQPLERIMPMLSHEMEKVQQAIRNRAVKSESKVRRAVEGETRYQDVTVYPLVTNGVEGAVIRVDDVTDRVRIEEMMIQSEKMLSVGGLAAGMAHEINNPLGVILQASQNVLRRVSPELAANAQVAEECGTTLSALTQYLERREIPAFLEDIRQSGQRAAGIVSNMLSFSRKAEAGGSSTDLCDLLDKTLALAESDYDLKKKHDFRKIEIIKGYEADVPLVVCQSSKIQQVFLNILRNGAEAMYEHGAKGKEQGVAVETPRFILRVMREREMIQVEIEDNGPGMDEATRRRVFEPFFTTKPPGVGTGLGLSVSYFIIVEEHGGTIAVESNPGEGARFIIRLPVEGKSRD